MKIQHTTPEALTIEQLSAMDDDALRQRVADIRQRIQIIDGQLNQDIAGATNRGAQWRSAAATARAYLRAILTPSNIALVARIQDNQRDRTIAGMRVQIAGLEQHNRRLRAFSRIAHERLDKRTVADLWAAAIAAPPDAPTQQDEAP
jgi:hypothetical protein